MRHPKIVVVERDSNDDSILVSQERLLDDVTMGIMKVRSGYGITLRGRAFYLRNDYDWIIGNDETGVLVLVPLKKI